MAEGAGGTVADVVVDTTIGSSVDPLGSADGGTPNNSIMTIVVVAVLLVLALGMLLGVLLCRRKNNARNEIPAGVTVQNALFPPTRTATSGGQPQIQNPGANVNTNTAAPRGRSVSTTLYAIPMETAGPSCGAGGAAPLSSSSAQGVKAGEVMYVSALNQNDPEYAAADISALYSVVSKPTTARQDGNGKTYAGGMGEDAEGRYSGYAPPQQNTVEYATPVDDDAGGVANEERHYDLAQQDSIENHYDLPAPGTRSRRKAGRMEQSEA